MVALADNKIITAETEPQVLPRDIITNSFGNNFPSNLEQQATKLKNVVVGRGHQGRISGMQ